jgi:L-asparaginase/Glu-tRNA(Gln) amidotransferase subunit D
MHKHTIAIVLVAALCISLAAPMDADAAVFLAAIPVIWAVVAAAGVTIAAMNDNDDSQQTQQATNTHNQASLKETPTQFAEVETSATFTEESYEMDLR